MKKTLRIGCLFLASIVAAAAAGTVRAEAFRVTTLRAAPGQLEQLIAAAQAYRAREEGRVIIMRHSQGDHWDLLLLEKAGKDPLSGADFGEWANFQHAFVASSESSFSQLSKNAAAAKLYHIEMFHALAGKKQALLDQRGRENQYLQSTGQVTNAVFSTDFGSDVDVFTLGFHADMSAFARGPSVSDVEAETAAREAGFKDRADLGFFLRSLLDRHYDTLAVPVGD